jgi:hypothetical protein
MLEFGELQVLCRSLLETVAAGVERQLTRFGVDVWLHRYQKRLPQERAMDGCSTGSE